jgi:hypothetical protein
MKTIQISADIGRDIRTRSFFRRDIDKLIEKVSDNVVLDFTDVVFISRSVADEICNVLVDYNNLDVSGMSGDVEMMFTVVRNGRSRPRVYPSGDVKIVQLNTLDEMERFFMSL